jgi:hypothetical protein
MESEIQGLEDLHGYFVQQDKVVAISFQPQPKRKIAPALIERLIPPVQHRPLDPEPKPAPVAIPTSQDAQHSLGLDLFK